MDSYILLLRNEELCDLERVGSIFLLLYSLSERNALQANQELGLIFTDIEYTILRI